MIDLDTKKQQTLEVGMDYPPSISNNSELYETRPFMAISSDTSTETCNQNACASFPEPLSNTPKSLSSLENSPGEVDSLESKLENSSSSSNDTQELKNDNPASGETVQAPTPPSQASAWGEDSNFKPFIKSDTNYVGLVNQAMTCYLNSLLQALYMTPEFRNALYNWEYEITEKGESCSIPYQLQKLFLNLQTSKKSAVETTALTKSFGWNSNEAWQQHDIQELCRVMFDALEQKFKDTKQADLIKLYEGKMIDYVKCLECNTENSREDTFLDIPLPVKPFGSKKAYNSVEEAMKAFVQYEKLEGNNQYHCDKCNKKCDAYKGLKFTKFPYLLTLHLKRFDFDYKLCHRIKLNDKVTFPYLLNLNSFISSPNQDSLPGEESMNINIKSDDSLTTDSGTLDDESPPCENGISSNHDCTNHDQDDDEGIDISTSSCINHNHENERNHSNSQSQTGPYVYELFSIMIHSGSASGGHYYAYIKDFETKKWSCFNDQCVTQITEDDIEKTYGGGPVRTIYSSAYGSSSTNAYMLMYRQIDPERNALPMQVQNFPPHIQELLKKMSEREENDRSPRNSEKRPRIKICCYHPRDQRLMEQKTYVDYDTNLGIATEQAYNKFNLKDVVDLDQCRLVAFDDSIEMIKYSFEGKEEKPIVSLMQGTNDCFLLEIRQKNEKFPTYLQDGLATRVFVVDVPKKEIIDGPINVRALRSHTVKQYKQMLSKIVHIEPDQMKVALKIPRGIKLLDKDDDLLQEDRCSLDYQVFVARMIDLDPTKVFDESTLHQIIPQFRNKILVSIFLPEINEEILENLNIPPLQDEGKDKSIGNGSDTQNPVDINNEIGLQCNEIPKIECGRIRNDVHMRNSSPQLGETEEWNTPEQSNSEDSSLSDSDKTLVGDPPDEDDPTFRLQRDKPNFNPLTERIDKIGNYTEDPKDCDSNPNYYFKAWVTNNQKIIRVLVDNHIPFSTFKKKLEPLVGVPKQYFSFSYPKSRTVIELENDRKIPFDDRSQLDLKLGKVVPPGEWEIKVYQWNIDSPKPFSTTYLFDWIGSKRTPMSQVKEEIIAKMKRKLNIVIPYERCRLSNGPGFSCYNGVPDDQTVGEFLCTSELFVHEAPSEETSSDQIVLCVRRWWPDKMILDVPQQIAIDRKSVSEIKHQISPITDIPEEHIEICLPRCYDIFFDSSSIHKETWFQDDESHPYSYGMIANKSVRNGTTLFYRDSRVKDKTSSPDQRSLNYYRPERRLGIHLDSK